MARQVKNVNESESVTSVELVQERTLESYMDEFKTKSAVIRHLINNEGRSRGAVAKFMGIRYQHVRNVIIQPVKKVS